MYEQNFTLKILKNLNLLAKCGLEHKTLEF